MVKIFPVRGVILGYYTLISSVSKDYKGNQKWLCKCICGKEKIVRIDWLRTTPPKSCGCKRIDIGNGARGGVYYKPEYKLWRNILDRCYNPDNIGYKYYGGRGITVCDRWRGSFENFLSDMGNRPKNLTLDRINNDGNYEPNNCRWSTMETQANNRRVGSLENHVQGETHGKAKLNNVQVLEIKSLLHKQVPQKIIAEKYKVSINTISGINCGITWKNI